MKIYQKEITTKDGRLFIDLKTANNLDITDLKPGDRVIVRESGEIFTVINPENPEMDYGFFLKKEEQ